VRSGEALRTWAAILVVLIAMPGLTKAATYTWTGGGGANTNWSSSANWGGAAPGNNETNVTLVFPPLAAPYASHNDRNGLQVTSLTVTAQLGTGAYTFTGTAIALNGPVTMASPGSGDPNLVWQIAVVLGGDATISTSGRQTQWQAAIELADHTLTLDTGGDLVLAGVISGTGNLVKNSGSALTVTAANTYTGSTTGNGGAFYIDNAAALGSDGAGTTFNAGFLGFGGETFTISEPLVFNGGGIVAYGEPTIFGQLTLNATIEVQTFEADTILTIGGAIVGSGGLDKSRAGLLILSAPTNAYAGATTVEAGALRLASALASTNPVTVQSGGTLQGDGSSAGTISVEDGGTVAPGAGPGQLSSAGLSLVAGAIFAAEIDGPNAATQYDQISVGGPVTLGGATLSLTLGYAPADGQEFTLIRQRQGQPVSGTFAGLDEGATFVVAGTAFQITYQGGSGHDVVIVAGTTPTPTTTPTGGTPTNTPAVTPTAVGTAATATATPTVTLVPTPTATGPAPACTGDCNGDGVVTVNEIIVGVNIALGNSPLSACRRFDADNDGRVMIPELIQAVGNVLSGC
jgi:fibronectin-binding autotransporter adhesin